MSIDESGPNPDDLRKQLEQAQEELRAMRAEQSKRPAETVLDVAPINEADVTLRRLVQRIAMILQAEKIVIMFYDRERGDLNGIPPAYGVDEERLSLFRVKVDQGISGLVFRESQPVIFHDANTDPRTQKDPFRILHVLNGVTVPLVIEKRDEENRVTDRTTIGVLHAFNKRHGEDFNDEDVRLLERMARNVGSIIANLQLYREVVEEREELLQTFESLTAGLVLVSPDLRISQMNGSARAIFGAPDDVIGKNAFEILNDESLKNMFEANFRGEESGKLEFTRSIAHIERIYEALGALVRNEEGKNLGVVAIFNDITDIRNIDRMKSSFVAMASHELRTPLTAIKGFVSTLLMDDTFQADERREFHMIIDQECDRLTRLINDLLNTARIDSGQSLKPDYKEVDINQLLEKDVLIQRQTISAKHQIALDIPEPLPRITADEDKFDQIITNLLGNAVKYSPNGGTVTVLGRKDGDHILIGIRDQGLGIPADHLNKVFERFHRVNNEDNRKIYGTGLGLYLSKHLVESVHLGKIWVESEVGVGSTFWIRIPVALDVEKAKAMND